MKQRTFRKQPETFAISKKVNTYVKIDTTPDIYRSSGETF